MTQFFLESYLELNSLSWTYNILKPPKITVKNVYKDIKYHIKLYKGEKLSFRTILGFIFLRLSQRLFYTLGWKKGGNVNKKPDL